MEKHYDPSILQGSNIINLDATKIDKLQRTENTVYEKILEAPENEQ